MAKMTDKKPGKAKPKAKAKSSPRKAKARPVNPMRMRWALLPA